MISRFSRLRSGFVLLAMSIFVTFGPFHGYAAVFTVTNANDSGAGSLRQAIADAVSGDTIDFNLTYPATIISAELQLNKNLTIAGPGARKLTISGADGSSRRQVFNNISTATISGLTISNGSSSIVQQGGGINNSGNLTLSGVKVNNCVSQNGGGGIFNSGILKIYHSTISGNWGMGEIAVSGAGIYNDGTLELYSSTISNNFDAVDGSPIYNSRIMRSFNSTITANGSTAVEYVSTAGTELSLYNTIITDNIAGDLKGTPDHAHNNLIQTQVSGTLGADSIGNITGTSALLGLLTDNGGPTDTHALQSGSPAINAGELTSCQSLDQRGVSRIRQGGCDIGAYEVSIPLDLTPVKSVVSTIVGQAGISGYIDSTGASARLNTPTSVATDGMNLYVADRLNHAVRKIVIATGAVTTLAGSGAAGFADGSGPSASFNSPYGLIANGTYVFVADTGNNRIRRIVIATGAVTTIGGNGTKASVDGPFGSASFDTPVGLVLGEDYIFVSDNGSHRIRKINKLTAEVTTLAGSTAGYADDYGAAAQFNSPFGLATDGATLYVADEVNSRIRTIDVASGKVSTLAGNGTASVADGIGTAAQFAYPTGLALDEGQLYVSDKAGSTIRRIDLSTGQVTTIAGIAGGIGSVDGVGTAARFNYPSGMVHDGVSLFVADTSNHTIRNITPDNAPPTDGVLFATPVGNSQIDLAWTAATDSGSGIQSYRLAWAPGGTDILPDCSSGVDVGNITGYNHTGLSPGEFYEYKVCAVDNAGNMSSGAFAFASTSFVVVTPISYDYGSQQVGTASAPVTFTISNTNLGMPVSITPNISGADAGDFILDTTGCGSVPPFFLMYSSSCTLTVAFAPTAGATAARSASLSVQTNETGSPTITSTLSGSATVSVTAVAGVNGSITLPGPALVAAGTNLTYTITPDTGYHIAEVLVDSVSFGAVTSYTFTNLSTNHTISASFAINTYTLTYSAGANGTISGTTPQTVNYNASGTAVTAVPSTGYHFVSWSDGVTTATRTDSSVTANVSVTASFANSPPIASPQSISVVENGSLPVTLSGTDPEGSLLTYVVATSPANGTISGTVPNLTYTPVVGYIGSDNFTFTVSDGVNISATATIAIAVTQLYQTVTFAAGANGTITGTTTQTIPWNGTTSPVQAVPNVGFPVAAYHFVNWTGTGGFITTTDNPLTIANVTSDMTITASFAINTYTLTYSAVANGTISGTTTQTVNYNASGTAVTAVPATGYHFVSWSDGVTTATRTDSSVTANVSVTASFAINSYTLTYSAGANGTISGTTPQTVNYNASGTAVTAVPATGYHFVSWSDGVTSATRTDSSVTANLSVTASFAINTYTLTYSAVANGTISGTTLQTVNYNTSGTAVTAVPSTGYHFVSWSDGVTSATRTDSSVTANLNVTASFAINTYTLTYSAGANGTISGTTPQTVNYNASGTAVTAVPSTGYHFVSWSDGVTTATRTDSSVTANVSVTASFAINSYTVTASAVVNGSISPAGATAVNYGASQAYTITPVIGYYVASVTDTCGGSGYSNTLNDVTSYIYTTPPITAACAVSATFANTPDGILIPAPGKTLPDLTDALKALKISFGMEQATQSERLRGDVAPLVNGIPQPDGQINLGDAVVLLRRYVGLVSW